MIEMRNRAILSGLDLSVEAQNLGLLRISAEGSHASRYVRVCTGNGAPAAFHISPLRGSASGRSLSAGVLVPGSVLCDGLCTTDRTRVVARHRGQLARPVDAAQAVA